MGISRTEGKSVGWFEVASGLYIIIPLLILHCHNYHRHQCVLAARTLEKKMQRAEAAMPKVCFIARYTAPPRILCTLTTFVIEGGVEKRQCRQRIRAFCRSLGRRIQGSRRGPGSPTFAGNACGCRLGTVSSPFEAHGSECSVNGRSRSGPRLVICPVYG